MAVVIPGCWSISPQGTALGNPRGAGLWVERQDLSPRSHIILERKFQCQARQEDFMTDGKVRVRKNPRLSETSSALGEGRRAM